MTLLSRPPGPTVLVGPAHCTYLCKSSKGEVDNCCCGGPNDCSENILRCGDSPAVIEMSGYDAEILCGEWELGDAPSISSEEEYNIILNIKEIIRHPDYTVNIKTSAYLQNDIAVFKINESPILPVSIHICTYLVSSFISICKIIIGFSFDVRQTAISFILQSING